MRLFSDEAWYKQIEAHLSTLQRQGSITLWHAHKILAGSDRNAKLDKHLSHAPIIVLLISSDFIKSEECWNPYLRQALTTCERMWGSEHPDTLLSLNNLATLYRHQGRYQEAEPLLRQSPTY